MLAVLLALSMLTTALADAPKPRPATLRPTAELKTPQASAAQRLGVGMTVHVLLQLHARYIDGQSIETEASRRCREQALATIRRSGVRLIVVEGHNFQGTLDQPQPLEQGDAISIGGALVRDGAFTVYGFERPDILQRSVARMTEMRVTADQMTALRDEKLGQDEKLARLDVLQRSFYEANTEFVLGAMPLRSFLALETALAVAHHHGEHEVFLVIGRSHWPDFPHALQTADRLGNDRFVGLRLLRYDCT